VIENLAGINKTKQANARVMRPDREKEVLEKVTGRNNGAAADTSVCRPIGASR